MYETSVYPISQNGSTGMAFKAGAAGQNLTESQFGIASVKFRWNLSGSYQQVIPRYFSTDREKKDEREFLNDFFPDYKSLLKAIFLKGYQWPFDPAKISECGSSLIDLLVHREINEKGREVYIDFTKNPSWITGEPFSLSNLDAEAYNYLENSGALKETPLERLIAINPLAYSLYSEHGIDLSIDALQIAVCAQHNNGGLKGNIWWESDLRHLFPVGEVNGSHGVYRPGGSALNSGQVGSYRAALYISRRYKDAPPSNDKFLSQAMAEIAANLNLAESWLASPQGEDNMKYLSDIRKRMSRAGGIIRDLESAAEASAEAADLFASLPGKLKANSVEGLAESFLLLDLCLTHYIYLEAIRSYINKGGRSRGSYIVIGEGDSNKESTAGIITEPGICQYDREVEKKIVEVCWRNGAIGINLEEVREIPSQNLWFEKVWKDYIEDNWTGS